MYQQNQDFGAVNARGSDFISSVDEFGRPVPPQIGKHRLPGGSGRARNIFFLLFFVWLYALSKNAANEIATAQSGGLATKANGGTSQSTKEQEQYVAMMKEQQRIELLRAQQRQDLANNNSINLPPQHGSVPF
jgi:hypothetical protein